VTRHISDSLFREINPETQGTVNRNVDTILDAKFIMNRKLLGESSGK